MFFFKDERQTKQFSKSRLSRLANTFSKQRKIIELISQDCQHCPNEGSSFIYQERMG